MNYCNVNIDKLIKFSPEPSRGRLLEVYEKFARDPHNYPIRNSQGYYRKYGIKFWIEKHFPNISESTKAVACFVMWCTYNNFSPDEVDYDKAQDE